MGRILHLISQLEEGGAQRQLSYAVRFTEKHETEIASLIGSPDDKLFPFFRSAGVPIHYLSYSNDFYAPEVFQALDHLLSRGGYSLVHCWLFPSIVQGVVLSRLHGIPCIASPRNKRRVLTFGGNRHWERNLIRKALTKADLVVCPSFSSAADYLDSGWVDPDRLRVVQNGVDCDYFSPSNPGTALVSIGRFSPEKGYQDLDWVLTGLKRIFPELQCIAAGGGKKETTHPMLERTGFVDDIRSVLGKAAVYITTSLVEGMSNALLEAQAMGIPAVARRTGSNSEIIDHGMNGLLSANLNEFIQNCERLLSNPNLRHYMGQNARQKMQNEFSIKKQAERLASIYNELL
jgi:glycosyltransferase involved in cell wall biosynthesis